MAAVVIAPTDRALPCRPSASVVGLVRPVSTPSRMSNAAPRRLDSSVYLRRRIAVLVLGMVLLAVLVLGASRAIAGISAWRGGATTAPTAEMSGTAAGALAEVYVVQPGDTLWSIAERVAPGEDPRPIVDRLAERAGRITLHPGQRLSLAGVR